MNISDDIYNFAYSCIIDGGCEGNPITPEEAEYTLRCLEEEDEINIINIKPEEFVEAWKHVLDCFR